MAAAAMFLIIAACSGSGGKKDPTASPTTNPAATPTATAPRPTVFPTALATVAPTVVPSRSAVPITGTGDAGGKITITLPKVTSVVSTATGPGQLTGKPAVAFTVAIKNGSAAALPLDTVDVVVTYGTAATPASPVLGSQTAPLHGPLPAGATTTGVYVFEIPAAQRSTVRVTVTYSTAQPAVIFSGALR